MKPPRLRAALRAPLAAACALALAACSDRGQPVAPDPAAPPTQPLLAAALRCTASVRDRSVSCAHDALPDGARGYIVVGGQHLYVDLTSSNVAYNGGIFSFDVTVKNLIPQPMATTDGVTADAQGVRVIFATGPVLVAGSGNVSLANADGTDAFTGTNQPFFRYTTELGGDGILSTNETSAARNWQLNLDNTVTTFQFTLYVVAEVPKPQGYVDILGGAPNLLAGDSLVLADSVRSAVGALVPSATVTWASADSSVATVDGAGVVHGVGEGSTVITATSGVRTGSLSVAVCPNLAVGQVFMTTAAGAGSLCLSSYGTRAEYTYMPVNLLQAASLSGYTVAGTGIDSVFGNANTIFRLPGEGMLKLPDPAVLAASDLPILERGRADAARLMGNPNALLRRGRRGAPGGLRSIITPNVVPAVGDSMDLNTTISCGGTASVRRGVVRSVKQHVIIVADTANPPGGFTTAQYDSIALEFDTIAWPVDTANFGAPTDLDGNQHVVAFFTRAVNELSPPASSAVVLGFWAGKDMFSSAPASCPNSNEGEMFYMLVPDPTGVVNSNVRTVSFVRGNTTGTLGHEFQHLINGFRRTYDPGGQKPLEEGFLNEGLSHVAEELMFYRASVGLAPRQNIVVTQLTTGPNASRRVAAFNTYANPNYGRLAGWLQRPDTTGAFKQNQNSLAVRGAIWAFLRYASDRVNGSEQAFWYSLVNSGLTGTANLQAAIGGADPAAWERDFITAMYADDNAYTVNTEYRQPSWNFRSIYTALNGRYVMNPRKLAAAATPATSVTLTYGSGGSTAYFRFAVPTGFGTITASQAGGVIPGSPFALMVLRTK
ncbi:MAG TPA: Ig-like domain-containing protein [Longimicrobium sp.]|nr:Ig-like domain-containing protein [Longimicrobium sp.]